MKVHQSFKVDKPREQVRALFQDIPRLAECMPGASLDEIREDGVYAGQVSIKLGPFKASFQGEARHTPESDGFSGHAEGKGIDKRGGSRSSMVMEYVLTDLEGSTEVTVDADIQLSGPIAQFGRVGVIEQTANMLISQFARNIESRLAGDDANTGDAEGNAIKVLPLLRDVVVGKLKGGSNQT